MATAQQGKEVYLDGKRAERARKKLAGVRHFQDLAVTFKAMGDLTRTKILYVLGREELCVGDLATLLEMTSSAISHQLRLLRNLKLVRHRRDGKVTYYALDDMHIANLMTEGLKHVSGEDDDE